MDHRQIVAEWAWISKEPGARDDYAILAASEGQTDVRSLAWSYVAGIPDVNTAQDAPMASPWLTFGSHRTSPGQHLLSVSVQDPWHGRDQARRPIWPRRFFLCGYDDAASAGASYRTLAAAVASARLPRDDRRPVLVAMRPQRLSKIVTTISAIGFDRIAAMAAALLDGPVAVTGTIDLHLSDPSARADRLAVLDAVAALLPYGFRADLSASTAVDNTVAHRMRLVLAAYPTDSQQGAPLLAAPLIPASELARDYLAMLLDKERIDGLGTVVGYLHDATDACSFDRAETAAEILDGLNRHCYRIRAARDGAEGLALSRAFFSDEPSRVVRAWHDSQLDGRTRDKLLRPLLDAGEQDLAELVRQHWKVVADEYVALVIGRLDDGDIGSAVRSVLLAGQQDEQAADRLLDRLVSLRPGSREARWPDIETRAELLRQLPVPAPASFALTRDALRQGQSADWQGQLVGELLLRELSAHQVTDRALAWASWLSAGEASACDWVIALGCVLADADRDGDGAPNSLRSLVRLDTTWAAAALGLARRSGRLLQVLGIPGLADDLVSAAAAVGAQPGRDEIRRTLASAIGEALWEHDVDPAVMAAVDAARTLLGDKPSAVPEGLTRREFRRYDEGLRRVLRRTAAGHPKSALAILRQIVQVSPQRQLSDVAVWLLKDWSEDKRLAPVVAGFAATAAAIEALTSDRRLTHDFWQRLTPVQPALRQALAASLLRDAIEQVITDRTALTRSVDERFGVTASKPALAMYRARSCGMPIVKIIELIRDTSVDGQTLTSTISHRELDDVLCELEFLLTCSARAPDGAAVTTEARRADAEISLREFRDLICAGALGTDGAAFSRFLDRRLKDEEAARRRLRLRLLRQRLRQRFGRRLPTRVRPATTTEDE